MAGHGSARRWEGGLRVPERARARPPSRRPRPCPREPRASSPGPDYPRPPPPAFSLLLWITGAPAPPCPGSAPLPGIIPFPADYPPPRAPPCPADYPRSLRDDSSTPDLCPARPRPRPSEEVARPPLPSAPAREREKRGGSGVGRVPVAPSPPRAPCEPCGRGDAVLGRYRSWRSSARRCVHRSAVVQLLGRCRLMKESPSGATLHGDVRGWVVEIQSNAQAARREKTQWPPGLLEEGAVCGCDTETGVGRYRGDIAAARGSERTWTAAVGSQGGWLWLPAARGKLPLH